MPQKLPGPQLKGKIDKQIALALQGGGALGSYQAGVYEALTEYDYQPDWVAGVSIGAINCAIIAGNAPEHRVARLRQFWELVSSPSANWLDLPQGTWQDATRHAAAIAALLFGQPGFFRPSIWRGWITGAAPTSYYDTSYLKATLERLVDFDRINARKMRLSVGAVNVRSGNFVWFDNARQIIRSEHVMASGALPPGFPAIEIDGECYWDGGLVSNTPLRYLMETLPRRSTLAFQVDLFSARGDAPENLDAVSEREKDIRYSSRTRFATDQFKNMQTARRTAAKLLKKLPKDLLQSPEAGMLAELADEKVYNIIQLIYRAKNYEGCSKDYEFSRRTMEEHWKAGYTDAVHTLRHPEVLQRPGAVDGVFTFDLAHQDREAGV